LAAQGPIAAGERSKVTFSPSVFSLRQAAFGRKSAVKPVPSNAQLTKSRKTKHEYLHINVADRQYGGILQMTKEWDGIPAHRGV
jgi:hypothetical protein